VALDPGYLVASNSLRLALAQKALSDSVSSPDSTGLTTNSVMQPR
jgi:hypothetical protein